MNQNDKEEFFFQIVDGKLVMPKDHSIRIEMRNLEFVDTIPLKLEKEKERELESDDIEKISERINNLQIELSKKESYIMISDTLIKFLSPAILTILIYVLFLLPFQVSDIPKYYEIPITSIIGIVICILLAILIIVALKWRIRLRTDEHNVSYYYKRFTDRYLELIKEKKSIAKLNEKLSTGKKTILTILSSSKIKSKFKDIDRSLKNNYNLNYSSANLQEKLSSLKESGLIHIDSTEGIWLSKFGKKYTSQLPKKNHSP